MKFTLGQVAITRDCLNWFSEQAVDLMPYIRRHHSGDWGDLSKRDKWLNEVALETGGRLVSAYNITGHKIYVITEWDRSITTMMLAEDY